MHTETAPWGMGAVLPHQREALQQAVRGQHVVDLGAGGLMLAYDMMGLGAAKITAVDQAGFDARLNRAAIHEGKLVLEQSRFADFSPPEDARVGVLSWPVNRPMPELIPILDRMPTVVLISKNTDGIDCGWPGLYVYLCGRNLLRYEPDRRNTLIVYGPGRVVRPLRGEERAGARSRDLRHLDYADVES